MNNILIVDDEFSIRESFTLILEGKYKITTAASGEAALKVLADQKMEMAYLDIRMPGMDGIQTLRKLKEIDPQLEVVMVTAVNDVQKASEAVKLGAREYVIKPFDVQKILKITEQILRKKSIVQEENAAQKRQFPASELVGHSEKIIAVQKCIAQVKKDQRVLILGEKGTEKETIVKIIHQEHRTTSPLNFFYLFSKTSPLQVKILLFGCGKGESTVNLDVQKGVVEETRDGTLFIDNLPLLPRELFQAFLSSSFSREGSNIETAIECNLIGGAAVDFRESQKDLFDYFGGTVIQIPPLRERSSDIPLLANRLIEALNNSYARDVRINKEALDLMAEYNWPGNVRELELVIERLFLASKGNQIDLKELPFEILLNAPGSQGKEMISTFDTRYIVKIFEETGRDVNKAASFLGLTPTFLTTKV